MPICETLRAYIREVAEATEYFATLVDKYPTEIYNSRYEIVDLYIELGNITNKLLKLEDPWESSE